MRFCAIALSYGYARLTCDPKRSQGLHRLISASEGLHRDEGYVDRCSPIASRFPISRNRKDLSLVRQSIGKSIRSPVLAAETGYVPINNNAIERLMKQVALGRKNSLFVGIVEAGERAAKLMSLVSSPKRHDFDVWFYLKEILELLLAGETDYRTMLPGRLEAISPRRGPYASSRRT